MMKKILCLILALLMCTGALMACAEDDPLDDPDGPSQGGEDTPDAPEKDWSVFSEYEAGKSDFEVDVDGETRFYKVSVKDEL